MLTELLGAGKLISGVLDKVIPDPNAKADAEKQIMNIMADNAKAQMEVNKVEASHKSIFVAGWRPAVGWVLASSIAFMYLIKPIASTILFGFGMTEEAKLIQSIELDTGVLMTLLGSMLGIGGMRSFDKVKGVDSAKR